MSAITTHILDISTGVPARGVSVMLQKQEENTTWTVIGKGITDDDGRLRDLLAPDADLSEGNYRLIFDTGAYFQKQQIEGFYPQVTVAFIVRNTAQHYHVPLLLSPFGYSTYRGS
jgi:5-hydroxyisourate hydrolase